jgi:hypothetical protein
MIALIIIPLIFADPDSRKVLVPDGSRPSERFAGEDGEGFYSVVQARMQWEESLTEPSVWRHWLSSCVAPSGLPLYTVACVGSQNMGIYIEHFSAPTDADNHFEDTPLLTLPSVPEDTLDTQTGPVERTEIMLPGSAPATLVLPQRYDTTRPGEPIE